MNKIDEAKQAIERRKKELEFKSFSKETRAKLEALGLGPASVGKMIRRTGGKMIIK